MTRIAVAGAAGRMGRRICALCSEYEGLELTGAFDIEGHPDMGKDMGVLSGFEVNGVALTAGVASISGNADILIDFTAPEATIYLT